ncbi:uncharacterized protein LOC116934982 [Daphnia magna]|uniref:uncharacterized protein LOC116934982 n=1 Tax=Daphnia magna TaxID=35525 RepID=UPI001E1BCCAB|nr:uncharacterized protein LOC116934982 [Daphnia magna]
MKNFYDQVDELYEKHKFDADSVFNADETNNTTVVEPAKIIAQKGTHQVYQMTSQERGVNVTMLPFVNASGKLFGGVFVFPRKKVSEKMKNLPEGFIALAHSSGWMTEENFLIALKHFHSQVQSRPTKEKPILLFLDNHISHMGYSICIFAKENGIILQTLPPHTSHASQPLDRTTFGPFKSNLADSHSDWMREHPGQRISIYEIPLLSKPALQRAFTEKNIKKGFKATGLFPFNRNAIPDSMYAPSIVTDLPAPTEVNSRQNGLTICNAIQHLPISVNQTLRFEMPSSIAAQHTTVATQEPPKSHYLLTVSSAGQLTLSPISVSPVAQPQAGPPSEIRSSSSTPIIQTEHERTTPTGSPSTINDMASPTASLPNQLSPQQLLTTPVKFREPHSFRPHDFLQLPQVAQNGPRNSNHNKRLGASRCLTSSPEIKRIREEHEEKERKLKAAENRKIAKATKAKAAEGKRKSNKVHSVEEDQYFETTPAVSNPQQGRKRTSRVLRYDKENVSSINLVEEEEDLPSEPRNSPVVPRRERITRAVKQNRMRNVCGR